MTGIREVARAGMGADVGTIVATWVGVMALRKRAPGYNPAMSVEASDPDRSVLFVKDGQEHPVDLGAPKSVRKGRRRVVHLIDLWVAAMLPADFLELKFELVGRDAEGLVRRSPRIDALTFSRGFVTRPGRRLGWECPGGELEGVVLESILVHPAPVAPVLLARPANDQVLPRRPAPLKIDLRLLPHAVAYPRVEWRSV
jgi:hypothetical protein